MTAAAHTVSVFQKCRAFCFLCMGKEETVRCQPAIRIRPAACKESIDLIFRDKDFLLIPLKALSCLIRLEREGKLLKLFGYFVRAIERHPHHAFIFGVGFCQSQKTFVQVSQKFRLVNQLCKSFCKFRVSTGEDGRIGKDHLCHTLCHIAFHIAQGFCVFMQSIATGCIQDRLWCVLSLLQKLMDSAADIFPGQKCFVFGVVPNRIANGNLHTQLIEPDRIFCATDLKALAALAILFFDESGILFRGLFGHKVIDKAELAFASIASRPQDFIHNFCRNRDLIGILGLHRGFDCPNLLFHGRQTGQRKSRGNFFLCFAQILFGCVSG